MPKNADSPIPSVFILGPIIKRDIVYQHLATRAVDFQRSHEALTI